MPDFLLELRCEEIPARMQAGARWELERLFCRELEAAGVTADGLTVWSTPRRLALIARGLPDATQAVSEEAKGPPEGAPEAAIEGFCRRNGVTKEQLQLREVKGRPTWFAVVERPGRPTSEVLAEAIPAIVRDFAWPKSMRWGAASLSTESPRWIRPLAGIVAILGEELVACEAAGIASGYATLGHRFHHPGPITIGGAHDYQEKLRACHVIVDHEERAALIREGAARAAAEAGLALVEDEGLVVENAGLTEWPVPLLGRFDEAFLDVPPEVIQLTARVNQKYFVCRKPLPFRGGVGVGNVPAEADSPHPPTPSPEGERELANAFVCTANIAAADGGERIVEGNRRVLAARLSDARFFWEQDRKTPLAEHARKLERITFHEKLGTVADKVERVAKLARWLVEEGIVKPLPFRGGVGVGAVSSAPASDSPHPPPPPPQGEGEIAHLADLAEQAARLCKADLVTEMVGEFPELQGVMGGYYARAEGLDPRVADAIRDHYKPVGQGDEVPREPVTVAVSLADKLDTLVSFFAGDEKPTGSKDPYALRRNAIALTRLILENDLRGSIWKLLKLARLTLQIQALTKTVDLIVQTYGDESDAVVSQLDFDASSGKIRLGKLVFELPVNIRSYGQLGEAISEREKDIDDESLTFVIDRLKVQQREAGVRHDLIDAVFALGGEDDLVRLLARVSALQHYIETAEGADLLAAYKRAANILKKESWSPAEAGASGEGAPTDGDPRLRGGSGAQGDPSSSPLPTGEGPGVGGATPETSHTHPQPLPSSEGALNTQGIARTGEEDPLSLVDDPDLAPVVAAQLAAKREQTPSYTPEPAETALVAALDSAEPKASAAIEAEDFAAAMSALASLRAPIDRFFDEVTVNDPDPDKRAARLNLLARFRDAVHRVADFSRIEG